jgi:amino acid permease
MIAGMLTAIKSFVEDAFHKQNQTLSTIEYENNKILLLDYYTFKMAFVVSGIAGADFKSKLQEKADAFVTNYLKEGIKNVTSEVQKQISLNLENHFINHD